MDWPVPDIVYKAWATQGHFIWMYGWPLCITHILSLILSLAISGESAEPELLRACTSKYMEG